MKKASKTNIAAYRVLRTLLCLYEQNMSMDELVEKLNLEFSDGFNNFVASKYINTCKSCGIDIQKINGKYSIMSIPFGKKFSEDDVRLLYDFLIQCKNVKINNIEHHIESFLSKLHITLFKSSNGLKSSENYRIVKLFEKAMAVKSDIELLFDDGRKETYTPVDIIINDGKLVLKVKQNNDEKYIHPDDISDIKVDNKAALKAKFMPDTVIFELYGKLAKRYQLRENEQIIKIKKDGTIVVSNKYEDLTELKRRLMRYDALCKVAKPQEFAEEMIDNILGALNNYSEEDIAGV